ncbi:MAG: ABC transporter substrate-binding protein [Dehalococcoidia bacterium]
MDTGYWESTLARRVGRRRALAATGGLGLGAAFLAACGGGTSGEGGDSGSSLVAEPADTTKQAKRGGIMKDRAFADPSSLDILTPNNPITPWTNDVYNSLVQFEPGYLMPTENAIMNDLAESWETSADGLTITMKIRQGVRFHNKPPVNNRTLDMDDILFSWQRFSTRAGGRVNLVNSINPDAPVLSLAATDARTVVLKLKEPLVYALNLFVPAGASGVYIVPKEADSALDLRRDQLGTGPWYLDEYTPSVGVRLKRHADFWDKDYALVDQIEMPILSEYTAALSQFKAGNTYGSVSTNTAIRQEDVLFVKKEDPRVSLYQGDFATQAGFVQNFGWHPEGKSPFMDERVRQAVSMAIDRDLFIDTVSNVAPFRAEGLPVETRWNSHLNATTEGWWLDPKGKDFGPNAKYFKLDIAEAKKLMAAAGFPNGFETKSTIPGIEYPPGKYGEIIDGMVAEIGIKTTI